MHRAASTDAKSVAPNLTMALGLLWLAGAAIRLPLLVVPPIIPLIHRDLHMSETQVGLLMGLPLSMFALAAIPGSLLIARIGALPAAAAGLSIAALASAGRAAAPELWTLYLATLIMGLGIAIFQPALPALIRLWAPTRAWLASAVSTNGMLVGVTLGAALTAPLVLPLAGGSWRFDLAIWAVPGFAAALLFTVAALVYRGVAGQADEISSRWWPDWRSPTQWLLGLTLGSNKSLYFAVNGFIPDYLASIGRTDLIALTLACLNGSQLVTSCIMLGLPERVQRQPWPFTVFGPITIAGLVGLPFTDGIWIVVSAIAAGTGAAVTFVVSFMLPAVLSPPGDVPRVAGGMFAISYTIAIVVPVICGAFWDLTGLPWTAFIPMALCGIGLTVFGTMLTLHRPPANSG